MPEGGTRLIHFGVAVFAAACLGLFGLGYWFGPPEPTDPGYRVAPVAQVLEDGSSRVTLDVRDQTDWVGFSLELGRVVPEGAAADLMVRRHMMRAPRGARDLGEVHLDSPIQQAEASWESDVIIDGVPRNPALSSWYRYSYMTHLLRPKGHAYEVRLARDAIARVVVESYYCKPEGSGCLTLRYRTLP